MPSRLVWCRILTCVEGEVRTRKSSPMASRESDGRTELQSILAVQASAPSEHSSPGACQPHPVTVGSSLAPYTVP